MPIYEYECEQCGACFEHLARRLSEPAPPCPTCGAADPRKLLSSFSAMTVASSSERACPVGNCPSAKTCPSGTCPMAAR